MVADARFGETWRAWWLGDLIGDLVDLAALEAGRLSFETRPESAETLIRETEELAARRRAERGGWAGWDSNPGPWA
ncbi:MAG: hypothetical protein HY703_04340 [Gemmatimonadetes bacterium]|nr:hypothetical protein [Gemmatimonadota bacterium]